MERAAIVETLVSEHRWYRDTAIVAVRAGFRCEYCGRDLLRSVDDYESFQIDHVWPRSKMPPADLTPEEVDEPGNKALACKPCNFFKSAMEPSGGTREERVASAIEVVKAKRLARERELDVVCRVVNGESPEDK